MRRLQNPKSKSISLFSCVGNFDGDSRDEKRQMIIFKLNDCFINTSHARYAFSSLYFHQSDDHARLESVKGKMINEISLINIISISHMAMLSEALLFIFSHDFGVKDKPFFTLRTLQIKLLTHHDCFCS